MLELPFDRDEVVDGIKFFVFATAMVIGMFLWIMGIAWVVMMVMKWLGMITEG